MAFMNVALYHEGEDISDILIRYHRVKEICSSIGTIEVVLVDNNRFFDAWDVLTLYEGGIKKGEFYIVSPVENKVDGTITIRAQDASKLLTDYFIDQSYTIDYYSLTRDWIEQFLTEAGVTYNITGGEGVPLSENTSLGMSSAYDDIMTLLQYSGWYLYFNANNTAIVGSLSAPFGNAKRIQDNVIRGVTRARNDSMLRNRAVVWGNYNADESDWVHVDKSTTTPWNYDANDKRAVVVSNSRIRTTEVANEIANKVLTEFARINDEKIIEIIGYMDIELGDIAFIESMGYKGSGLVTTVDVTFGEKGLITTIILDQRCPRLFAYWSDFFEYEYVYIGTAGDGVHRKPLSSTTWQDYNDGLVASGALDIRDLYVANDNFALITMSGDLYYRDPYTNWRTVNTPTVIDQGTPYSGTLYARGLAIDHNTNEIICGYNSTPSPVNTDNSSRAWVVNFNPNTLIQTNYAQVYVTSGDYRATIVDLDTNDRNNIVSVAGPSEFGTSASGTTLGTVWNMGTGHPRYADGDLKRIPPRADVFSSRESIYFGSANLDDVLVDGWYVVYVTTTSIGRFDVREGVASAESYFLNEEPGLPNFPGNLCWLSKSNENEYYLVQRYVNRNFGEGITYYQTHHYKFNFLTQEQTYITSNEYTLPTTLAVGGSSGEVHNNYYIATIGQSTYVRIWYVRADGTDSHFIDVGTGGAGQAVTSNGYWVVIGKEWLDTGDINVYFYSLNTYTGAFTTGETNLEDPDYSNYTGYKSGGESGQLGEASTKSNAFGGRFHMEMGGYLNNVDRISPYAEDIERHIIISFVGYANNLEASLDFIDDWDLMSSAEQDAMTTKLQYTRPTCRTTGGFWGEDYYYSSSAKYWNPATEWTGSEVALNSVGDIAGIMLASEDTSYDYVWGSAYSPPSYYKYLEGHEPSSGSRVYGPWLLPGGPWDTIYLDFASNFIIGQGGNILYICTIQDYDETEIPEGGNTVAVLRHDYPNIFSGILYPGYYSIIEVSKPAPTEVYVTFSGDTGFPKVYQSFINAAGEFSEITADFTIYDMRVFDINTPSGFVVDSGILESYNWRYAGLAIDNYIRAFPTTLSGDSVIIGSFEGSVTCMETSNYGSLPYIFAYISGAGTGSGGTFYQRDPYSSVFEDHSISLPTTEVTIIRVDDRI